jgi:Flp pilus assembly protein TadG
MDVLRRILRARDGASAVEFALLLPLVMGVFIGGIEFGRLFWQRSSLEHAVEETGRYAMAHTDAPQNELTRVLRERAAVALPPDTITVSYAQAATAGINYLTITATHSFSFMTGLIPVGPITLQSRSRVPLLG